MKKNLLKTLAIITLTATALPVVSSCGNKSITPDFVMPENGFNTDEEVSISFYHTMGQPLQDVLNVYLEDFKEMYPNINVKHNAIGAYDDVRDQMTTELSAGQNSADLAYCYPDHVALYNKAKSVVTLDTLIDDTTYGYGLSQAQIDDFIPAYYEEGRAFGDGKMYSLPFSKSSEVLYYDKTFFDENKLTVPTTWDEMEEVCAQIKRLDPNSIPLGYDSESNLFITLCEQFGSPYTSATGDHFLFDNDTNKAFVSRFKEWYDKGYITTKEIYAGYTSSLFISDGVQRSYMCIGSSAGASYQRPELVGGKYRFEVGITSIPQQNAEKSPAVISQGPSVCIFRNKDPQKVLASWLLVKFLTTNTEFQAQFSMSSGYTPVLNSSFENPVYKEFLNNADGGTYIAALSTKVCVEQRDWYYYSPAFVGSSKARDTVGALVCAVLLGRKSVDAAFKDAIEECRYYTSTK